MKNLKQDFPIFKNQNNLAYLDNSSTTQMSEGVVKSINKYNTEYKANIHRGLYKISELATQEYEKSRSVVANFINAKDSEIIFNSGTTFGINHLAYSLCKNLKSTDNIVLTIMEHHANFVPWQQLSKQYGFEIRLIELDDNLELDIEKAKKIIDNNTKIVSFVHISNTIGTINPAKTIVNIANKVGAISIIDGAQSIAHMKVDVKEIDCDFFVFSGHKVGGPTGVGVIYGKSTRLEKLEPFIYGGSMINEVNIDESVWNEIPYRFEAGTPNISGVIGLGKALEYINKIGLDNIIKYEQSLTEYAIAKLNKIDKLKIIGSNKNRVGIISCLVEGLHPHDIATILDKDGVAVRAGLHCTEPLMNYLQVNGTIRVSFWVYNDKDDVDRLVMGIKKAIKLFKI
ncbi:MAG: hypothetical protein A2725_04355 [Candidatus Magasanikbacteria bacterium RIFCSPHIGHO2_01_FULL_33_34]|uniref:Cysteine desulfurase n=1 Tax=Candidatus Magasanikbacteria bacterium RIFCSPHIGHO2_01_FULL_33_34 TaxID=1798671 RepID=A0A1F6LHY7_9BACT|nr:MAG: hypothetical protein A2725_04355 [Candidatus Magasanikbacteria bacterium RIFCSPHIGHO2_01_FULL_33_34]OGH65196.1 MAG: hypothetical protein A3B83_04115 [Candidatus Magasanikbacteria bacterium RIFCSPHIGHO2_02_FULL_33_17]OGH75259.1 MAG: hypothetical protein A3A89_04050 [Candidatus Magasanikbacteria bacterium RIFCSPLOWO2_01_FULL_33_34]OGH82181.1 MAG: hypothetical protein A3F93_00445 [Candidatus Magasanikbacteria bacterium RIFCSPLOWO2_12_FULL_34_7]